MNHLMMAWDQISPSVITLLSALLLLLVGVVVAKAIATGAASLLKAIKLDDLSKTIKFDKVLANGGVTKTISELLGELVFWILVFVAALTVLGYYGLPVQLALTKVVGYTGIVFLASFILGAGLFTAGLVAGIVKFILGNLGLAGAKTVSRVLYYIVIVFAFLSALAELGISTDVFIPQIGVIIGAFGLAAAIAFGLGCKDMAADFLSNLFRGK